MNSEIKLNDIADELLILNKQTIDTLFKLDNCSECIALYVFYYKTAKWQKTNTIKANDTYVKKSLKWGNDKIRKTKETLKENGLIDIVQNRKNGKIDGWYIKVAYIVQKKKVDEIKIKVEESNNSQIQQVESNNSQIQQVAEATSSEQNTNALKEYIKCLKKEIEMLKNNNKSNTRTKKETKHKHGEYSHVLLTDSELEKLKQEYPNFQELITFLDEYMEMTGKKYKSCYLAIKKWVVNAVNERKAKQNDIYCNSNSDWDDIKEIFGE